MSAKESPLDIITHDLAVSTQEQRLPSIQEIAQAQPKPFPARPDAPASTNVEALKSAREPFFSTPTVVTTSEQVQDLDASPFEAVGRLNFQWRGKSYFGTAWAVSPTGLITAAHNVCDKDSGEPWTSIEEKDWSSDVVFRPQYNDGHSAGTFRIKRVYILRGWTDGGTTMYDLAACVTDQPMHFTAIPIAANLPLQVDPLYASIGYPGQPLGGYDFNGKVMWKSMGDYVKGVIDQSYTVGSVLSQGASGGPWWVKISGKYYANGLTSRGGATTNSSPYFGTGLKDLYEKVI
jgi:V8-like Glu-specific endopeptidase